MPDPTLSRVTLVDLTGLMTLSLAEAAINDAVLEMEEEDLVLASTEIRHQDLNGVMSVVAYLSFHPSEGAGSMPGFSPFVQPDEAPYILDFFDDGEVNEDSTLFDPGSSVVITEVEGARLKMVSSNPGNNTLAGRVWALPDETAFNITLGVNMRGKCEDFFAAGILFAGDDLLSAPTTAKLMALYNLLHLSDGPGCRVEFSSYQRYNLYDTLLKRSTMPFAPFLRVAYDGTHFTALAGYTGNDWIRFSQINASTFLGSNGIPRFAGPYVLNDDTGGEQTAEFTVFRVDVTDDPYAPMGKWFDVS